MKDYQEAIEHIRVVKAAHESELMAKANVVGVGIGFRHRGRVRTDDVVLVVLVEKKQPRAQLDPKDLIPRQIEGVAVDVQESGRIESQAELSV
jgi:hypothetical protein